MQQNEQHKLYINLLQHVAKLLSRRGRRGVGCFRTGLRTCWAGPHGQGQFSNLNFLSLDPALAHWCQKELIISLYLKVAPVVVDSPSLVGTFFNTKECRYKKPKCLCISRCIKQQIYQEAILLTQITMCFQVELSCLLY